MAVAYALAAGCGGRVERGAMLEDYVTVVGVTPRSKRAIFGRRYLVKCECGWSSDCRDYIFAKRRWREHKAVCPAHNTEKGQS